MATTAKVFKYIGFGILGIGAMFFFVWLVMLLWNALIPELFNGPVLSYWQTAGIFILSKILLTGIGGGGGSKSDKSKNKWKSKYHDKYRGRWGEEEVANSMDSDPEVQPGI